MWVDHRPPTTDHQFYASLFSALACGATTSPGLAYLSRPNPRGIVARIIADEKKYGEDTPIESKAHPKNSGAIIRATPPYVCCIPIYKPRSPGAMTRDS